MSNSFHVIPITSDYDPIWVALKKDNICRVSAPRPLHPRIKKAVYKRKDLDLGYKLQLKEKGKVARLSIKSKQSVIEFKLVVSIGLEDL